jgi:hypothetical protein
MNNPSFEDGCLLRCDAVVWQIVTNVSEEVSAYIFRVYEFLLYYPEDEGSKFLLNVR